jgi:LysM repeat protein
LCGSRVAQTATQCQVCGTDLNRAAGRLKRAPRRLYPSPIILGLLVVLMSIGVIFTLIGSGKVPMPQAVVDLFDTSTPTNTFTPLPTPTPTPTASNTPVPTATLEPPIEYVVQPGDSCLLIALINDVTVDSIIMLNGLGPDCVIAEGHTLLVPRPSPTPAPRAAAGTSTLAPGQSNGTSLPYPTYVVLSGDSCLGIAAEFDITLDELMNTNGIGDCSVLQEGKVLYIPILQTPNVTATPAPTDTPAPPTPRAAPTLVQPGIGQSFAAGATITLSWTGGSPLGQGEFYRVTVEDLTCNCNRRYVTVTTQTSLALPPSQRPSEATAHIFSWMVEVVRQTGTSSDGQAVYEASGAQSTVGTFTWTGTASASP